MKKLLKNATYEDFSGLFIIIGVFMAIASFGYILGSKKEGEALNWALETTRACERTLDESEFESVSACMESAIVDIEASKRDLIDAP